MIIAADVKAAAQRIEGRVHRTPLVRSATLSERLGANVFVKLELFQKTGSFKPRGAFNVMLSLTPEQRSAGVVGFSGGNFAQGMAYAGSQLGIDTLVVMPKSTAAQSITATRGYGAQVELVDDIAAAIAATQSHAEAGRTLMHPFDNPMMMAGNGTAGLEILEDVPDLTHLFVSVGGGGLLTGITTAVLAARPNVRVIPVETEGADALARSLAAGQSVTITPTSIAKTLGSPYAAADAITLAETRLADVAVVSDASAFAELCFLAERLKVVAEPAAACTLAAAADWKDRFQPDDKVVLLLCGGNVSVADISEWSVRFADTSDGSGGL